MMPLYRRALSTHAFQKHRYLNEAEGDTATPALKTTKKTPKRKAAEQLEASCKRDTVCESSTWKDSLVQILRSSEEKEKKVELTAADYAADYIRVQLKSITDQEKQSRIVCGLLTYLHQEKNK